MSTRCAAVRVYCAAAACDPTKAMRTMLVATGVPNGQPATMMIRWPAFREAVVERDLAGALHHVRPGLSRPLTRTHVRPNDREAASRSTVNMKQTRLFGGKSCDGKRGISDAGQAKMTEASDYDWNQRWTRLRRRISARILGSLRSNWR